ncbi:Sister chromatid cohesion protein 2 [Rhizophlyctis rosea]|uniref:Sister chromatid cohesion protein n=1 Tax=Rhizophlyctis rosea TaxID=64517 RepID=A0AAD5X482_9FUNG|nr:Sister chromatid cohesion protein 2 [Rhizophlyctis rosea]
MSIHPALSSFDLTALGSTIVAPHFPTYEMYEASQPVVESPSVNSAYLGHLISAPTPEGSASYLQAQEVFHQVYPSLANVNVDYLQVRNVIGEGIFLAPSESPQHTEPPTHDAYSQSQGPLAEIVLNQYPATSEMHNASAAVANFNEAEPIDAVSFLLNHEQNLRNTAGSFPQSAAPSALAQMCPEPVGIEMFLNGHETTRIAGTSVSHTSSPTPIDFTPPSRTHPPSVSRQSSGNPGLNGLQSNGVPGLTPTSIGKGHGVYTGSYQDSVTPVRFHSGESHPPARSQIADQVTPSSSATSTPTRSLPPEFRIKRRRSGGLVEVEIPKPKTFQSPRGVVVVHDDDDDALYRDGSQAKKPRLSHLQNDTPMSSLGNVVKWDASLRKAVRLIQSIFQVEDSGNGETADETDAGILEGGILTRDAIQNLAKYFGRLAKVKHLMDVTTEVGEEGLARLLKLVEARIDDAKYIDAGIAVRSGAKSRSPKKRKGKGKADDLDILIDEEEAVEDANDEDVDPTVFEEHVEVILEKAEAALGACVVVMTTVCAESVERRGDVTSGKRLYGEDLLLSVVNVAKMALHDIIYAVVENAAREGDYVTLAVKVKRAVCEAAKMRSRLSLLVGKVTEVLDKLCDLTRTENLSDDVMTPVGKTIRMRLKDLPIDAYLQIVYLALSPFFVELSDVANLIFARYPGHRNIILQEILTSLTKLSSNKKNLKQYRLPDGKSIQMVTALLLQLFQSCCSQKAIFEAAAEYNNAYERLRKVADMGARNTIGTPVVADGESGEKRKKKKSRVSIHGDVGDTQEAEKQKKEEHEDKMVEKFVAACKSATQATLDCVQYVLGFLVKKSVMDKNDINAKVEKGRPKRQQASTTEAEYKAVLDNLMSDVITVLNTPEWPVAETVATVYSQLMITVLEGTKKQGDTLQRQMAIEWLGIAAGRIRKPLLTEPQLKAELSKLGERLPKAEIDEKTTSESLSSLWTVQRIVGEWLESGVEDDPANQNARMYYFSCWGGSLIPPAFLNLPEGLRDSLMRLLLDYCLRLLGEDVNRSNLLLQHDFFLPPNAAQLHSAIDLRPTVGHLIEVLAPRQPFFKMFEHFLHLISTGLMSDVAKIQTKALKATQEIIAADPTVLNNERFKTVVLSRLHNSSVSVRDAAVELVTKHLLENQEVVREYYKELAGMIWDEGTSVRKRVIKLLRDIYMKGQKSDMKEDREMVVDASWKLLERLREDEEDSVRDTAFKFLVEIWFSPFREAPTVSHVPSGSSKSNGSETMLWSLLSNAARQEVRQRALLIGAACGKGSKAFTAFLQRYVSGSNGTVKDMGVFTCLVDSLVEEAIALEESLGADGNTGHKEKQEKILDVFRTLSCFSEQLPHLLAVHLKTLRPYLVCTSTEEVDEKISFFAIEILRHVITFAPNPVMKDMKSFQNDICKGLNDGKPIVLSAAVPAVLAIVQHGTKDYNLLIDVLGKCFRFLERIRAELAKPNPQLSDVPRQNSCRSQLILAKLLRGFDFDGQRNLLGDEATTALNAITKSSILEKGFATLLSFTVGKNLTEKWISVGISSLTDIFIGHPRLLQREDAGNRIAEILQGTNVRHKTDLLKMMTEVVNREYAKSVETGPDKKKVAGPAQSQAIDIKVLIGSSEDMGDMGVGMSIMNRFLGAVLSCMLGTAVELTAAAYGLVDAALEQGIVHPVACVAAVAAMQASPDKAVQYAAFRRQRMLYTKHNHLMHPKNVDCVRVAYEYRKRLVEAYNQQAKATDKPTVMLRGYNLEKQPLLSKLYTLLQPPVSPKAKRDEFNKNMIKMLDCNIFAMESPIDPLLARFVAENIALFAFKNQEEVLVVLQHIHRVLSITGETVRKEIENMSSESPTVDLGRLAQASLCMGVLILLGNHLQKLYGISSERIGKHVQKEKGTRANERAVQRQAGAATLLTWEKLPLVEKPVLEEEDIIAQFEQYKDLMANDKFFKFEEDEYEEMNDEEGPALFEGSEVPEIGDGTGVELLPQAFGPSQSPTKRNHTSTVPPSPAKKRKSVGGKRQSLGGLAGRKSEGAVTTHRRSSVSGNVNEQGGSKKRKRGLANLSEDSDGDDSQADPSWA